MTELQRARRYWRIALLFPLLASAIGWGLMGLGVPVHYGIAVGIVFGPVVIGLPYVPFALVMAWLYGRAESPKGVIGRAALWPFVFMPLLAAYYSVNVALNGHLNPNTVNLAWELAGVTFVFGYGYFFASLAAYLVLETVVKANHPPHDTSHFESHPRQE